MTRIANVLSVVFPLLLSVGTTTAQTRVVTEEHLGKDTVLVIERNVMVPMRDGVKLATDIYRIKGAKPAPALVARTPYGKNDPWFADWKRYVKAGYVLVCQDVRGRYASEGDFRPHFNETVDGVDCFAWVTAQPWCDGNIGTFGGSYLGGTQWLPARENPEQLKAMVPEITFSDMYEGNTHPGGVKVLHDLRWAAGIVHDVVRRKRDAGERTARRGYGIGRAARRWTPDDSPVRAVLQGMARPPRSRNLLGQHFPVERIPQYNRSRPQYQRLVRHLHLGHVAEL